MKEQKLILVTVYGGHVSSCELDESLADGWSITQISGSFCSENNPCCFVLLERDR